MRGQTWYQQEEVAESYEAERFGGRGGTIIDRKERSTLLDLLGDVEGKSVLEVATGTGRFVETLGGKGCDAVGLDVSKKMMLRGRERCGGIFVRGDAANLPFEDDRFDTVMAIRFLHLLKEPEPFVEEMERVARSAVIFDTFNLKSGRAVYNRFLPMGSRLYSDRDVWNLVSSVGLEKVRRRDEFVLPFGSYRYAPDFLAGAMRGLDEALISLGPGRSISTVTYWKASVP